ncbi:MAG: DUF4296 domain-containing protein [Bacteroidales bacterium]
MKKILLLTFVVLIASCGGHRPPKGLIPPEDMEKILVDVHIADALAQSSVMRRLYQRMDSLHYAQNVLAKYGYSQEQFDSTVSWYAGYPDEYEKLYEQVITRLNRLESTLKVQFEDSLKLAGMDNLWKGADTILLPRDGDQNKVHFAVRLFGPGIYTLMADIRIYPDDSATAPAISAWFFQIEEDEEGLKKLFPSQVLARADSFVHYSLSDTLSPQDSTFNQLEGYFLDHKAKAGKWKKHAEVRNIIIRFTPSDTLEKEPVPEPERIYRRMMRRLKPE